MKKTYIVTDAAGPYVAGIRNPGVDKSVELTESQAEHPLRLGHVRVPLDEDSKAGASRSRAK